MQSAWRVACVRIPRFPIGAVWQSDEGLRQESQQLELQLTLQAATPVPRRSLASVDAPSPRSATNTIPSPARSERPLQEPAAPDTGFTSQQHWDERCIALVEKNRIRAVSLAAGRVGLRVDMTQAQARGMCADLIVLPWNDVAIARAVTVASAAFLAASPQVTPVAGAPGLWWIGASGFGALGGERALLLALREIARRVHPDARVAIADSCVAARAATWDRGAEPGARSSGSLVPAGGCASYLAGVPLGLIPMDDELRATLQALGIRTGGALAALSAEDVERRWGDIGLSAWRLARGEDRRRPVLARGDAPRMVSAELSMSTDSMEPVLVLVRPALERLVADLVADGRAAAAVAITLTLDDAVSAMPSSGRAHTVTREVRPARPVARVAPLFEQCRSLLTAWPLTAPVTAVRVAVTATAPATGEQGDLLHTGWRDAAAAEAAFFRLRAELGTEAVVRPVARDEHRVDRSGAWVEVTEIDDMTSPRKPPVTREERSGNGSAQVTSMVTTPMSTWLDMGDDTRLTRGRIVRRVPQAAARVKEERPVRGGALEEVSEAGEEQASGNRHAVALRLLESPEPADVTLSQGWPSALHWRGSRHTITKSVGPERLAGDWWKGAYRRDYWRCRTDAPSELMLYRDDEGWWVQGWYD